MFVFRLRHGVQKICNEWKSNDANRFVPSPTEIQRSEMQLHRSFVDGDQLRIEYRRFNRRRRRRDRKVHWSGNSGRTRAWRFAIALATVLAGDRRRGRNAHTLVNQTHDRCSIVVARTNGSRNSTMIIEHFASTESIRTDRRKKLLMRCSMTTSDI